MTQIWFETILPLSVHLSFPKLTSCFIIFHGYMIFKLWASRSQRNLQKNACTTLFAFSKKDKIKILDFNAILTGKWNIVNDTIEVVYSEMKIKKLESEEPTFNTSDFQMKINESLGDPEKYQINNAQESQIKLKDCQTGITIHMVRKQ